MNTLSLQRLAPYLLLCLVLPALSAAAEEMEVFDLKGATPQELIPLIKPFVGPDGTVAGMHNQLIVRTSAERMVEVRKLVREFDRAPRRLLIHVRDTAPSAAETGRIDLSLHNPHLQLGETEKNRLSVKRYSTQTTDSNLRTLQTLEGRPTLISSGIIRPEVTRDSYRTAPHGGYESHIEYRPIESGFYATVQLVGERVRIEITTQKQSPIDNSATIRTQATGNVVSGALGEWLPLATTRSRRQSEHSGIGTHAGSESTQQSALWVRVELLPD